jgi:hypothetical protein
VSPRFGKPRVYFTESDRASEMSDMFETGARKLKRKVFFKGKKVAVETPGPGSYDCEYPKKKVYRSRASSQP